MIKPFPVKDLFHGKWASTVYILFMRLIIKLILYNRYSINQYDSIYRSKKNRLQSRKSIRWVGKVGYWNSQYLCKIRLVQG